MQTIVHPRSGVNIVGVRLSPGTPLNERDSYDKSSGVWEVGGPSFAGFPVPAGNHVIWVRQPGPVSENALVLLGYLCRGPWGGKTCIGERRHSFYVIPSPTFNWDGRFDIEAMRVLHSECVQELVDNGYLAVTQAEATNWASDYSTVWTGHQNQVYVLTEEGRRKGMEFLSN